MIKNYKTSRKKIVPINKNIIFIICTMVMLPFLFAGPASAYERPEFKDGVGARWHDAKICLPCHYMLAGTEKASAISSSCENCHSNQVKGYAKGDDRKIDMTKIANLHKDIVCIRCHVGLKSQKNVTAGDFHRVMSKTACLSCHTYENGTYKKPLKTRCSDCHNVNPHVVHGKRIEKMCVACHGEYIEVYVNSLGAEDKAKLPSLSNISMPNISNKPEYPSIGEFIIKLLGQFTQILR